MCAPPPQALIIFVRLLRRRTRRSALVEAKPTILADRIARSQNCKVTLSKETSGYHLYLPCPDCLETHGKNELRDPKYAINLSKYFGIGDEFRHLHEEVAQAFSPLAMTHNDAVNDEKNLKTGICMRTWQSSTPHRYPVDTLLAMDSITKRFPYILTSYRVVNGADGEEREAHWEPDPITGQLCPPPAGDTTPILDLPPDHPARWYLETYRKFDLQRLTDMFRCGFCTKEFTEGRHRIWYRKFPGGWKDTPQHRVIFHSLHKGVPLTWQGRYPEYVSPDGLNKYALHPYAVPFEWSHIATRATAVQAWMPVPPFDEVDDDGHIKFDPPNTRPPSTRAASSWAGTLPSSVPTKTTIPSAGASSPRVHWTVPALVPEVSASWASR